MFVVDISPQKRRSSLYESALRPVRDDDDEEFYEDENEVENA